MSSLPPQIGHFKVMSELGRGGMGVVYKVKDARNGQLAALKMIQREALNRADSSLRFKREFRAMQRVEHPNVIRVFEAGIHEGCPFFTMELVEGKDIRRYLDGEEPIIHAGKDPPPAGVLSPQQRARLNEPGRMQRLVDIVVQVAYAIAEIHSHRIVHRDLKPDNIIVSKAGIAKLMDFGIAKQLSSQGEQSSGGIVVGTFKYLSPEQATGGEIDGRADLYCLGIILYELLAGRHPFYSDTSVGYAYHHARKPPPEITRFNPEVDPGLRAVCEKLIKKDPRERYATAEDVIAAIRDAAADRSSSQPRPEESPEPAVDAFAPGANFTAVRNLPYAIARDQLFAPALIGRDAELRELTFATDQLLAGRGSVCAVVGPSGVGKSRLLREAAAQAKARNVDFVVGRCTGGAPYQPFLEILDHLVQQLADRDVDAARRVLGEEGRALARYVPAIERLPSEARPRPAPVLEPQGERVRFLAAVTSFLGRCAAMQSRVLVLDDIHRADELTLSLVRHLADTLAHGDGESAGQRSAPVVIALTMDPDDDRAADARELLAALGGPHAKRKVPVLALGALNPAQVQEMLGSMIGGGDVAAALAEFVHEQTAGVPGRVEERARAWAESGELQKKGRQWVFVRQPRDAAEGADEPVVVDVRKVTRFDIPAQAPAANASEQRIARLSTLARDVAERAAVVGDRLAAALLERVALRPEDELLDALDELVKREILVEESDDGGYRFVEIDDQRALIATMNDDRRRHLNLLVARALEDEARRHRRAPAPDDLARHYLFAGESVKAIEQLMAAARFALAASGTQSAAQRVREAQDLLARESGERPHDSHLVRLDCELVMLRLDVLAAVNEHRECVTLARRRLPRMHTVVDGRLVAEVLLRLAASERLVGELDEALEHTGQVLSRTERGGSHTLRCRAKSLCGQIYEQRGQFDLAGRYYADALELARTIGDEAEEERARTSIASRRLTTGDLEGAQRDFEQLLAQATARGEKLRVILYVEGLARVAHEQGRFDDAEVSCRRVVELAKPAGDKRSLATALAHIAMLRRDQARFDDATALTTKSARILTELEQFEGLAMVRIVEAQLLLDRAVARGAPDDNVEALRKAEEALDHGLTANDALKVAEAALCKGLALCRRGDSAGRDDIQRGLDAAMSQNALGVSLLGQLCELEARVLAREDVAGTRALVGVIRERAAHAGYVRVGRRLDALVERLGLS